MDCTSTPYEIVGQGGGNFQLKNSAGIVGQGGLNIILNGGGNIVAQGGLNIVAQGGLNLQVYLAQQALLRAVGRALVNTNGSNIDMRRWSTDAKGVGVV